MQQIGRNLLDPVDGFLHNATHPIHDRVPPFTKAWRELLATGGVKCVPIPAQRPNCNSHAERFVKTARTECLDHLVIFGERHLRHLLKEFTAHYLRERYHRGIGSKLIEPLQASDNDNGSPATIQCRSRLGGLLHFYNRRAAWRIAMSLRTLRHRVQRLVPGPGRGADGPSRGCGTEPR